MPDSPFDGLTDHEAPQAFNEITDHAVDIYAQITDIINNSAFAGLTSANALYQIAAVAVAVVMAYLASRFVGARLIALRLKLDNDTYAHKAGRIGLAIVNALLFSITAAVLLSIAVRTMNSFGLVAAQSNLLLIRVAYQIFYAWAILYVIMQVLTVLLGNKLFGAPQKKFVTSLFWTLAVLQIVGILPEIVKLMQEYTLPIGSDNLTLWTLLVGIITVLLTVGIANKLADFCESRIMGMREMEMNLRVVFARITRVSLMLIGVLIALSSVGINLTVLSVFGGALGVGIGFGMQKIASNYISGFIILFDRSVKLGDLVEVSGFSGVVTQINTRYSVLRNVAGEELIIPNENFVTGTVKNYTLSERDCAVNVEISCAYEADVDRALAVFMECIKSQSRVVKSREPWVVVSSFGASGINLKAGFWISDPQNGTAGLKSNILREVLKRFAAENIEIPYDKLDLTVKNVVEVEDRKIPA